MKRDAYSRGKNSLLKPCFKRNTHFKYKKKKESYKLNCTWNYLKHFGSFNKYSLISNISRKKVIRRVADLGENLKSNCLNSSKNIKTTQ